MGISLVELSKRLGKNRGTISRAAKEGRIPRLSDGTFDFDEVVSYLRKTEDPARYGSLLSEIDKPDDDGVAGDELQPDTITTKEQARAAISLVQSVLAEEGRKVDGAITFDDARTANEILKARKTLREIEQTEGRLLPRDEVIKHVAGAFNNYRNELRQLPARFGAQIAADAECDVTKLDAALTKVINDYLDRLAAPVVRAGD